MRLCHSLPLAAALVGIVGCGHQSTASTDEADVSAAPAAWSSWLKNPDTDLHLPNVSYAGYHSGEDPLPSPEANEDPIDGQWAQFDVQWDYGAAGDGATDDFESFKAALADARSWSDANPDSGAVVTIPTGRYLLSQPLFVHGSRVILRGTGAARSDVVLLFNHSLTDSYAVNLYNADGRTSWSWDGGNIWLTPEGQNTYLPNPPAPDIGANGSKIYKIGWSYGPWLANVIAPASRGDTMLQVSSTSGLQAGMHIILRQVDSSDSALRKQLAGGGAWADNYWAQFPVASLPAPVPWVVEIAAVTGSAIKLRQPLRFDVRPDWTPSIHGLKPPVRESGVEHLTVELLRDTVWTTATHHYEAGWNGVFLNNAIDCFVRDVTVVNPEGHGVAISYSKNVTVSDVTLDTDGIMGIDASHFHHGFELEGALDSLYDQVTITDRAIPRHGLHLNSLAMGNVYSRATLAHGTFDSHRLMPYENVHTEISIYNDGLHGGDADAGPLVGARTVSWNVTVTGPAKRQTCESGSQYQSPCGPQYMIANAGDRPLGAIVGVVLPNGDSIDAPFQYGMDGKPTTVPSLCAVAPARPPRALKNLYRAQLSCRLLGTAGNPACPTH
jgi:hypothetical protein